MKITKKLFVACPAYYATGGTELLHQLVFKLRQVFKVESYIFYPDVNYKFEVPPTPNRFEKYVNKFWVDEIIDTKEDILIIPETLTRLISKYPNITKVLWWLSLDNFFQSFGVNLKEQSFKKKIKDRIKEKLNLYPFDFFSTIFNTSTISLHLAQSYYAFQYLKGKKVNNISFLSDYINTAFKIKARQKSNSEGKLDQVLYNPEKGEGFTQKLIKETSGMRWVPIKKMQPLELAELMSKSKVYIDFGNHPGKDRIPREAVVNGCCIITNRKGSAANTVDIPIPIFFKVADERKNLQVVVEKIQYCFENYSDVVDEFENYRNVILREELTFEQDLASVLKIIEKW